MFPQKHFVILWIRERYILRNAYCSISLFLCGSIKSCQRRFNFGVFFFLFVCVCVGEGGGVVTRTLVRKERSSKYHYKRAIIDPPAKRHLNGVSPMMAPY